MKCSRMRFWFMICTIAYRLVEGVNISHVNQVNDELLSVCGFSSGWNNRTQIWDLFEGNNLIFQAEKENWSLVLWNNFNPKKLLAGIDSYLNEFEELSGKCKRMPISLAIKKHMLDFKRSIPLMTDLQNKALRQRHWNELMVKTGMCTSDQSSSFTFWLEINQASLVSTITGHEFNMDPLHTKMKHLFSMKLYEHYSLVAEIIANAQKEADIETKLSIISEVSIDCHSREFDFNLIILSRRVESNIRLRQYLNTENRS